MSILKYIFLILLFLVLSKNKSYSQSLGGNITLQYTGIPYTYVIIGTEYRECFFSTHHFSMQFIEVSSINNCGNIYGVFGAGGYLSYLTEISPQNIPYCSGSTTCNGGLLTGTEVWQGFDTIVFPVGAGAMNCEWIIRCVGGNGSFVPDPRHVNMNIVPSNFVTETSILVSNVGNSPPIIKTGSPNGFHPIPYGCINTPIIYDLEISDPDGDSLVFSLHTAYKPLITSPASTLFTPVTYNPGFSATAPIPGITINSQTGQLNFMAPATPGNYVIVVKIDEYNSSGTRLSSINHEFTFIAENCTNTVPIVSPNNITNFNSLGTNTTYNNTNNTISMCAGDQFCYDVSFSDLDGDSLELFSNITSILPNSTFSYVYTSASTATATVCWAFQPGYTGTNITITAKDKVCIPGLAIFSVDLDIPKPLTLSINDTICGNLSSQIKASGTAPLTWSVLSGPPMAIGTGITDNFSCQNCTSPIASPNATTSYVVTEGSSCALTDTVTIAVVDNLGGVFSTILTNDTTICQGECVPINALAQEQYTGADPQNWSRNNPTNINSGTNDSPLFAVALPAQSTGIIFDTILPNSICEICMDITYPNDADLDIYIIAPDGAQFLLSSSNGASNADYTNTCFTQTAVSNINWGAAPFTGSWIPQGGSLSQAFIGSPVQGTWKLRIVNNTTNGTVGTVNSWSIQFCPPFSFPIASSFLAWDNIDGLSDTTIVNPTICPANGGQYILTAYNIDNCFTTDTINIAFHPVSNAGADSLVEICKETGVVDLFTYLGGTPDNTGTWQDSLGNAVNPLINTNAIMNMAPYLYITQSPNGCLDSAYLTADIIEVLIDSTTLINPSCFGFCNGEITIHSPNASHYAINNGTIGAANTTTTLCANNYDLTAYYQLPDGNYCQTSALGEILTEPLVLNITNFTVNSIINPTTSTPVIVCKENTTTLAALASIGGNINGNHIFDWYLNANLLGSASNWSVPNQTSGNGMLILNDGICPADTAFFTIQHPIDIVPAIFVNSPDGCQAHTIQMQDISNSTSNYDITWRISDGTTYSQIAQGSSIEHTFTNPGLYTISMTIESQYGCIYNVTDIQDINVWPQPELSFTASPLKITTTTPTTSMVNLSDSIDVQFNWVFGEQAIPKKADNEFEPTVNYPKAEPSIQVITLTGSTSKGCTQTITGSIEILEDLKIFAPNAFTPNGSGLNDTWRVYISGIDIYEFELIIYNRYGEIVWKSYNSEAQWDGNYNNTEVMEGVYPWAIRARRTINGEKLEFKGMVTVVR